MCRRVSFFATRGLMGTDPPICVEEVIRDSAVLGPALLHIP